MKNLSFNKGRPHCLCIFIYAILLSNQIYAAELTFGSFTKQSQQLITGTVTDALGTLPNVTVTVKGTSLSTVTDEQGQFSITANSTDVLVFSFIGYITQEIIIGTQTTLKIILSEDSTQLKEVTINAGYYKVKDKERTGSIARITSKDIETQPVTNVLATMQGRMAGVEIIQDSGAPGGAFQIKIRGINSLRADGNEPFYIIDGVPFSSETIGSNQTYNGNPSLTSPLNSINPNDIESIEVLKDADATAIYGSRGANGVVLINTKKGKNGRTTFAVNTSTSFGTVTRMLDLMNTEQYIAMRREAFTNDGYTEYPEYAYDVNGTWDTNRYTDWQKKLIGGTSEIHNLQASVSGGGAETQYLLSGTYRSETTVMPGDFKYGKGAVHFNMNHSSENQKFKFSFSADYVSQKNKQSTVDLASISRTLAPNAPALYTPDGQLNWENSTWTNPLGVLEGEFLSKINSLNANTVLSYNFLPTFQFKTNLGFTNLSNNESKTEPSTMYDPAYGLTSHDSALYNSLTTRQSWIFEPQLNYNLPLGNSHLDALAGVTFQNQVTNRMYQLGSDFSSNNLIHDMASAALTNVALSDETVYRYQALFARINYNWNQKYIFNVTGRRDGSSRFGPGRQFANFGAVGAAWIFSKESFLKDNKIVNFGKLRASYGITGNDQIGDYQFLDTYTSSGSNYQGVNGLQPSRLYNPAFGWESNKKFEVALETGLLNDRLYFTTAYYLNRSSDQLVGIPLPSTTGFSSLTANLGATVQNSGLEVTLRTINVQSSSFSWTSNINISMNRNKLIEFPGLATSSYKNRYIIGQSINIRKLYDYIGMNPDTGVYEFADANGDGEITSANDLTKMVDLTPKYFGGFQNQITYKGMQLDFLFQFVKQKNFGYYPSTPGDFGNQLSSVAQHWQNPGDQSVNQPYTSGDNSDIVGAYYKYANSDAAITDASYIRLKNVSLTYNLPLPITSKLKCKLFVQGQNLLTFTSYNNGDPELAYAAYLPPLKMYTLGVQLIF